MQSDWDIVDLGRMAYAPALERQRQQNLAVSRGEAGPTLLLVEHDPVITISQRRGAREHLLASAERLAELGIDVQETDRGGDITYHGPGQLVAYPILRLSDYGLNLGRYMRTLESAVIAAVGRFGVRGRAEPGATGVWVPTDHASADPAEPVHAPGPAQLEESGDLQHVAKLCAMGVRVRKNTTLHGLALNVTTDLAHFATIDPCGLGGRPVTSLRRLRGGECPSMAEVKSALAGALIEQLGRMGGVGAGGAVPGAGSA